MLYGLLKINIVSFAEHFDGEIATDLVRAVLTIQIRINCVDRAR